MVKGVYKQVVVINPQNKSDFEQAIFILSQGGPEGTLKSPEEFVALANDLASQRAIKGRFVSFAGRTFGQPDLVVPDQPWAGAFFSRLSLFWTLKKYRPGAGRFARPFALRIVWVKMDIMTENDI